MQGRWRFALNNQNRKHYQSTGCGDSRKVGLFKRSSLNAATLFLVCRVYCLLVPGTDRISSHMVPEPFNFILNFLALLKPQKKTRCQCLLTIRWYSISRWHRRKWRGVKVYKNFTDISLLADTKAAGIIKFAAKSSRALVEWLGKCVNGIRKINI